MTTVAEIKLAVAHRFEVSINDIDGERRANNVAVPRQVCFHLAKVHTRLSLPVIGRMIGQRDPTTVASGIRSLTRRMAQSPELTEAVDTLSRELALRDKGRPAEIDLAQFDLNMRCREVVQIAAALGWRLKLERIE